MNFVEAQESRNRSKLFHELVALKTAHLGEDISIEDFAAAVNAASIELDPDHGELKYELDENHD